MQQLEENSEVCFRVVLLNNSETAVNTAVYQVPILLEVKITALAGILIQQPFIMSLNIKITLESYTSY